MDTKEHWEQVYHEAPSDERSWHQPDPAQSLAMIVEAGAGSASAIIDVGGGDSRLVDALLARGLGHVTVLDISGAALERAKERLGRDAARVSWIEGDVTRVALPEEAFDIWHDRAVLHFLTDPHDRERYVAAAAHAIRPGGAAIIAVFALEGPARCSGLPVHRFSQESLADQFAPAFTLVRGFADVHVTPSGARQAFSHVLLRRGAAVPAPSRGNTRQG